MAASISNGHLFKRRLMEQQELNRAEAAQIAKQFRRNNYDGGKFANDNSFDIGLRVKAPGRESAMFANKGKRKLPFTDANYMPGLSHLKSERTDPVPALGSFDRPTEWVKDKNNQSSVFASKTKKVSLGGDGGYFELTSPRELAGPRAGTISNASRDTGRWLLQGQRLVDHLGFYGGRAHIAVHLPVHALPAGRR